MPSIKSPNGNPSQFNQKLKNFFRINSLTSIGDKNGNGQHHEPRGDGNGRQSSGDGRGVGSGSSGRSAFRNTKFFNSTVGRLRSQTVASEGNALEETLSPTAHANPYFAHQGHPPMRHRNEGSVPPSPPDTPSLKVHTVPDSSEQATAATKEELARKLRRVASAPNAQGLFAKGKGSGERPATAELGKDPLFVNNKSGHLGFVDAKTNGTKDGSRSLKEKDTLGALPPPNRAPVAFRRTYSSNSIKISNVEVGPQSFDKIKLIGKGDVGKVYLVREKKSSRLYAMKGKWQYAATSHGGDGSIR